MRSQAGAWERVEPGAVQLESLDKFLLHYITNAQFLCGFRKFQRYRFSYGYQNEPAVLGTHCKQKAVRR